MRGTMGGKSQKLCFDDGCLTLKFSEVIYIGVLAGFRFLCRIW